MKYCPNNWINFWTQLIWHCFIILIPAIPDNVESGDLDSKPELNQE